MGYATEGALCEFVFAHLLAEIAPINLGLSVPCARLVSGRTSVWLRFGSPFSS